MTQLADVATHWQSTTESLPEEGERILVATPSSVLIGSMAGMTKDEPSRPMFIGTDHFAISGVKYWSRLPSVPQPGKL